MQMSHRFACAVPAFDCKKLGTWVCSKAPSLSLSSIQELALRILNLGSVLEAQQLQSCCTTSRYLSEISEIRAALDQHKPYLMLAQQSLEVNDDHSPHIDLQIAQLHSRAWHPAY